MLVAINWTIGFFQMLRVAKRTRFGLAFLKRLTLFALYTLQKQKFRWLLLISISILVENV